MKHTHICGAIALLALFVSNTLAAQHVAERFEFGFGERTAEARGGYWEFKRIDEEVKISGRSPLLAKSHIKSPTGFGIEYSTDMSRDDHYRLHGRKLERAGVIELDESLDGGLGIGAKWSYRYPAVERIRAIKPGIPVDATKPSSWSIPDLSLYEFGTVALQYIKPFRAMEAEIANMTSKAFEHFVLRRVLERIPEKLPEGTLEDPFDYSAEALAAIQLGPQARQSLDEVFETLDPGLANNPRVIAWRNWLAARYIELDDMVRDAMAAGGGLLRGLPLSPDPREPRIWPEADRKLLYLGTAAIRPLEALQATRHDYAYKAQWLLKEIRRDQSRRVLKELEVRELTSKIDKEHFKNFLNDYVTMVMCSEELEPLAKILRNQAVTFLASEKENERLQGMAMEKAGEIAQNAAREFRSPGPASKATQQLQNAREATNSEDFEEAASNAILEMSRLSMTAFGRIAVLHREAADTQAKFNWLYEQIRLRESSEEADGREFDFQNDIHNRGLNLRIVTENEVEPAIDLEQGSSYEFSFKYYAKNLERQTAWLRFIPLDEEGYPLYAGIEPFPKDYEKGEWVPFEFARDAGGDEMQSNRVMGNTGGWKNFTFRFMDIPANVDGLALEVRLSNVTSAGEFYFKDFKLALLEDYFRENFAADEFGGQQLPPPGWVRTLDPANNYQPWSKLSYNALDKQEGERSLQIEPNGFNVRMTTQNTFRLRKEYSYAFKGSLHTQNMEGMNAYFELLLYDEEFNPVTADGLATTEGNNVLRTPYRGDAERPVGWKSVRGNDLWFEEKIEVDEFRKDDLRIAKGLQKIDDRERHSIEFVKVAIVVEGPKPSYHAKVLVDAIELKEHPKVRLSLSQANYDPGSSLLGGRVRLEAPDELDAPVALIESPPAGKEFKLQIEPSISGLAKRRAGYHFEVTLTDFMGNPILASDTLGEQSLSYLVYSDDDGNVDGRKVIPSIVLDDLPVASRFGYFNINYKLRYVDEEEPLVDRDFKVGFLDHSLLDDGEIGEFGVIFDHASSKQLRVYDALEKLRPGRISLPLFSRSTSLNAESYDDQAYIKAFDYLLRSFPKIRKTGVFGTVPNAINTHYRVPGASPVYGDTTRDEWRKLLTTAQNYWHDRFDDYRLGSGGDMSYVDFSGRPAQALDNVGTLSSENGQAWAELEIPIALLAGQAQDDGLEAVIRSFGERWTNGLMAQDTQVNERIVSDFKVDERKALEDAKPRYIWLKEQERASFFVPSDVSAKQAEQALQAYLGRMARYEDILGDSASAASTNAGALIAGNDVNFSTFSGAKTEPSDHTIIIEIMRVDESEDIDFPRQLNDLTQKIVLAKRLGFTRIFVNRLRSSSEKPDGLLSRDNFALPAFYAYRTLNGALSHKTYVPDLKLALANNLEHSFFRSADGKELTFVVFPGENDTVLNLPFGNKAKRVDLMGNRIDLPATRSSGNDISASFETGAVQLSIPAARLGDSSMPIFVTGIDYNLLDTALSVNLDQAMIDAEERDNARQLQITNAFSTPVRVNLQIPMGENAGDDADVITNDARFKDSNGKEIGDQAPSFNFGSVELQPGETRSFNFQIRPRSTMRVGNRVLPVVVRLQGPVNYEVVRRVPVEVRPSVRVESYSLVQPNEDDLYELVFRVRNNNVDAQGFNMSVTMPDIDEFPRSKGFRIPAQEIKDVTVTLGRFSINELEGQAINVAIRQSPGRLFFNSVYIVRRDEFSNKLLLVEEGSE